MNQAWLEFLQASGASLDANGIAHLAEEDKALAAMDQSETLLCALSSDALIYVSGEDATTFLQGQTSNDLALLEQGISQLNSYNSPKGRMLAGFRISRYRDGFLLRMPRDIVERNLKRLRMFVLRSKVTLEDISDAHAHLGLTGDNAAACLQAVGLNAPGEPNQCSQQDEALIWRLPTTPASFEAILNVEQAKALWQYCQENARTSDEAAWQLLQVRSGLPKVVDGTVESFVPQMLNYDLIGGISFTKGCYPGQEIVARTHYLGKQKRRMYRLLGNTGELPAPGSKLYEHGSDNQQAVGEVVCAALNSEAQTELLAVVQIKSTESADLRLDGVDGPALKIAELPYEISDEK